MIKNVIFDFGGVLIDWNPEYVFLKEFRGDRNQMNWFFENICTSEWNDQQDAGCSIAQATEERVAMFPEYESLIRMYYGRWEEMLGYEITGTVAILEKLHPITKHTLIKASFLPHFITIWRLPPSIMIN